MLTISLHGIRLYAKIGLYPQEKVNGNDFEIDVDVYVAPGAPDTFPFIDYAVIYEIVAEAFRAEGELLETFVQIIHSNVKARFAEAETVRVAIRKLHPPLGADVRYSQVCFEQ